ncbi:hypothetical protein V6N13_050569 [Hibiscus sabdariffa]
MLKDVNWSYLKEIFMEVVPWSEKVSYCERATWIEVRGLPLHSWNSTTLKKIAGLGANMKHNLDCERVSVLIATKVPRRIEEVVEVEIGDIVFQVSVTEVGFNDGTSYPLCNTGTRSSTTSEGSDESTDVSKSDSGKRVDEECSDQSRPSMEEEAFQSRCKERDSINKVYRDEEALRGQINVSELMGGEPNMLSVMNVEGLEKVGGKGSVDLKEINDDSGNTEQDGLKDNPVVGASDIVLEGGFVAKCEEFKGRRWKGKGRKFGSLLDLQNQSISDIERKRRDIALKKKNWGKDSFEETELSGKSLSDSDINNRVSTIIKEAKQVLRMGEKIGVKFVGNEDDVINDLVEIELKD